MTKTKEDQFWQWFNDHQPEYLHLDNLGHEKKEQLLDILLKELHAYCSGIYFQIGGNSSKERRELIISAEGNKKYFNEVEKLVNAAPKMKGWQVIAFKQPMGTDFVTDYEGLLLNPKEMWFLPLNNEQNPNLVGLRICIDNYNAEIAEKYKLATYQVLDTILGEKAAATKIDYFDVDSLSNYDSEEDGLIELSELAEYIEWKRAKK